MITVAMRVMMTIRMVVVMMMLMNRQDTELPSKMGGCQYEVELR